MLKAKECLAGSLVMYPGLYPQFIAKNGSHTSFLQVANASPGHLLVYHRLEASREESPYRLSPALGLEPIETAFETTFVHQHFFPNQNTYLIY